ncbi:MAG: hypothetical protein IPJ31_11975 [Bacteroidetes bacterium]|nr:hypothetical protein [Bacteroidota bacterium]
MPNSDVGGEQPMLSDNIQFTSDGFETSIFDQGQGDDADSPQYASLQMPRTRSNSPSSKPF